MRDIGMCRWEVICIGSFGHSQQILNEKNKKYEETLISNNYKSYHIQIIK